MNATRADLEDLDRQVRSVLADEGPAAALALLRGMLTDPSLGPAATSRLAWLHERLGDTDQALSVLQEGHERFPDARDLVIERADMLARTDHTDAARALVRPLVDDADADADADALAALAAYVVDTDPEEGDALAVRALDEDPRTVRAHAVRIDAARMRGDVEAVLRVADQAVREVPDAPALRLLRASVRVERGDLEAAFDDLRSVWAVAPGHAGVRELTLEIVKRRQPLYRLLLAHNRLIHRLGRWALPAALAVLLLVRAVLDAAAEQAEAAGVAFVGPLLLVLFVFAVLLTWVADPVTDLLVDMDPAGSLLIGPARRFRAKVVGVLVLSGLIFGPVGAIAEHDTMTSWGLLSLLATVPVHVSLSVTGWLRRASQGVLGLVALLGVASVMAYATGHPDEASGLALMGALSCALSTWLLAAATWSRR